jgi:hypothetical protein
MWGREEYYSIVNRYAKEDVEPICKIVWVGGDREDG